MIAKSSWFSPRKFGGWGLTPNCWQGYAYIGAIILLMSLVSDITWLLYSLGIIVAIDFIDIFIHIKKDERDILHEALAERNAMWFMVTALGVGIVYQASTSTTIDPVVLVALIGSVIVKAISYWYLRNK